MAIRDGKYRSIFHSSLSSDDAVRACRDEMRAWLRGKNYDVDAFDRGHGQLGQGAVLLHNSANSADGSQTERWQLRESRQEGDWLSSLTLRTAAPGASPIITWFLVEVEHFPRDQQASPSLPIRAGVPRLVRQLLDRAQARDGLAVLSAIPLLISRTGVDELVDVLCDPDRRLPAVVASAHRDMPFEEWRQLVARVMRFLPGMASLYLLDPLATAAFGEAVGRSHAVWGGALRSYLPDVDPAVEEDGLRHRVLSAARITADPDRAAGILSVLPRRLAVEAPVPAALSGVNRLLLTQAGAPAADADAHAIRDQIALLIDERDTALELAEEQERRANTLFTDREIALLELSEREQQMLELASQVRGLQRRLVAVGQREEAYQPVEVGEEPPAGFADLLDWVDQALTQVIFTGDRETTLSLDQRPESGTWTRSSWEALSALSAYAQAKVHSGYPGDFKTWCENPPPGEKAIPARKVARDESETVRNYAKWRREREFPVPAEVDQASRIFMGAHIRIGAGGQTAPRLHFHDAIAKTGLIYVGYLGPHLTTTQT